jgi:hypothetical protein
VQYPEVQKSLTEPQKAMATEIKTGQNYLVKNDLFSNEPYVVKDGKAVFIENNNEFRVYTEPVRKEQGFFRAEYPEKPLTDYGLKQPLTTRERLLVNAELNPADFTAKNIIEKAKSKSPYKSTSEAETITVNEKIYQNLNYPSTEKIFQPTEAKSTPLYKRKSEPASNVIEVENQYFVRSGKDIEPVFDAAASESAKRSRIVVSGLASEAELASMLRKRGLAYSFSEETIFTPSSDMTGFVKGTPVTTTSFGIGTFVGNVNKIEGKYGVTTVTTTTPLLNTVPKTYTKPFVETASSVISGSGFKYDMLPKVEVKATQLTTPDVVQEVTPKSKQKQDIFQETKEEVKTETKQEQVTKVDTITQTRQRTYSFGKPKNDIFKPVKPKAPEPQEKSRGALFIAQVRKKGKFVSVGESFDIGQAFQLGIIGCAP